MKDKRPRPDPERQAKIDAWLAFWKEIEKIAGTDAYRTVCVNKKK